MTSLYLGRWARAGRCPIMRPTIVLDLDETLVYRPRGIVDKVLMYGAPWAVVGRPYAGSIACINSLAVKFNIVAVTARWRFAEASTEHMLVEAGLPQMPVIYAGEMHPGDDSRIAYKARAIRHLRDEGWAPFVGVGDRASDMKAYITEGLTALVVVHREGAPVSARQTHMSLLLRAEREILSSSLSRLPTPRIIYFTDCPHAARAREGAEGAKDTSLIPIWQQIVEYTKATF